MTRDEYVALHGREPHDEEYWGPGGVNLSRWGPDCKRGLRYRDQGTEIAGAGAPRHTFGGGRKARGLAADSYERQARMAATGEN